VQVEMIVEVGEKNEFTAIGLWAKNILLVF
jgi:hypothetical protein